MSELPALACPYCARFSDGRIFQDARGGFECTCCDGRFLIQKESPLGYGGPDGPLSWRERNAVWIDRWGWAMAGGSGAAVADGRWATGAILFGLSLVLQLVSYDWKNVGRTP